MVSLAQLLQHCRQTTPPLPFYIPCGFSPPPPMWSLQRYASQRFDLLGWDVFWSHMEAVSGFKLAADTVAGYPAKPHTELSRVT